MDSCIDYAGSRTGLVLTQDECTAFEAAAMVSWNKQTMNDDCNAAQAEQYATYARYYLDGMLRGIRAQCNGITIISSSAHPGVAAFHGRVGDAFKDGFTAVGKTVRLRKAGSRQHPHAEPEMLITDATDKSLLVLFFAPRRMFDELNQLF